jgi:hypothetical protein
VGKSDSEGIAGSGAGACVGGRMEKVGKFIPAERNVEDRQT